ncbi:hypothetical protein BDW72DRAFT_180038 [Aspergillus terricola var. indicus]
MRSRPWFVYNAIFVLLGVCKSINRSGFGSTCRIRSSVYGLCPDGARTRLGKKRGFQRPIPLILSITPPRQFYYGGSDLYAC